MAREYVLIRGSTTFFGARFCRRAVVEKADLKAVVAAVVAVGNVVRCRALGMRYFEGLTGRRTERKAERFIMVAVRDTGAIGMW